MSTRTISDLNATERESLLMDWHTAIHGERQSIAERYRVPYNGAALFYHNNKHGLPEHPAEQNVLDFSRQEPDPDLRDEDLTTPAAFVRNFRGRPDVNDSDISIEEAASYMNALRNRNIALFTGEEEHAPWTEDDEHYRMLAASRGFLGPEELLRCESPDFEVRGGATIKERFLKKGNLESLFPGSRVRVGQEARERVREISESIDSTGYYFLGDELPIDGYVYRRVIFLGMFERERFRRLCHMLRIHGAAQYVALDKSWWVREDLQPACVDAIRKDPMLNQGDIADRIAEELRKRK